MFSIVTNLCPKNYGYNKAVFFQGGNLKKVVFHTYVNQNKTQTSSFETSHFVLCKTIMGIAYYILLGIPMTWLSVAISE